MAGTPKADGFGPHGSYVISSSLKYSNKLTRFQRLRYMALEIREEISQFSFIKIDDNARAQLLYVFSNDNFQLSLTHLQRIISAHSRALGYLTGAHALP